MALLGHIFVRCIATTHISHCFYNFIHEIENDPNANIIVIDLSYYYYRLNY